MKLLVNRTTISIPWLHRKHISLGLTGVAVALLQLTVGALVIQSPSTSGPNLHCAQLVAEQTATNEVVPGAFDCTNGNFRFLLDANGWGTPETFAGASPAFGGPVELVGFKDHEAIYLVGGNTLTLVLDKNGFVSGAS